MYYIHTECTFLLRFVSFYGHLSFYQKLTRGRPSCFCPPIIRSGLGYTVIENIYDKHFLRCCCCYAPLKSKRVFVIPIIMFGTMCELVFTTKNEEINANSKQQKLWIFTTYLPLIPIMLECLDSISMSFKNKIEDGCKVDISNKYYSTV